MRRLAGRTIVVTRSRTQASSFVQVLKSEGARVISCPTIRIVPPLSWKALDRAVGTLHSYDWLLFTSANSVEKLAERMKRRGLRQLPRRLRTCAIGSATAKKMQEYGFPVHRISKEYVAESILDAVPQVSGLRILIPRAAVARDVLPKELVRRGAKVDVAEAYRTVPDLVGLARFRKLLKSGRIDCVTFTSASTVSNLMSRLSGRERKLLLEGRTTAASIGPITSSTLRRFGWEPAVVAHKPSTRHLAESIAAHFSNKGPRNHEK